ncbi:MAG: N-acetylmuramidase domain-containing protein, partial [Enterovibrio sp.]
MKLCVGSHGEIFRDLQRKLNELLGTSLVVDGKFGSATKKALEKFQDANDLPRTGYADERAFAIILHGAQRDKFISVTDLRDAADELDVDFAAIANVADVESCGNGFFSCGRPKILFERHVFYRNVVAKNADAPLRLTEKYENIFNPQRGGYAGGSSEYCRFDAACNIDSDSAICASSWGMFQIMGFHWKSLGYQSPDAFKRAMESSEKEQLRALIKFIKQD